MIRKIETLTHRDAQSLGAGAGIEKARRQCQRELVRVADAIVAQVAVLRKELREIEVIDRRIEHRRLILFSKWNVDVVGARLQRLDDIRIENAIFALEYQTGVEACNRDGDMWVNLG